ncbi:MAG: Nif3-like dinuclear metal center hexameric protein [Deltaproteobacteria bacterium RIFOXYD12_FULL_57_12]|nr:MAG: Nif3-like dinuclear metal center hexameric protein [Deltaproteobacteria bacterium RIFOXYD12_FULL_57_12]
MAQCPTVKDLLTYLDEIASVALAEVWDNVGLMVGNLGHRISGILIALDPTAEVLAETIDRGANVLVTHHPLIFHPLKTVNTDSPVGRFLQLAMAHEIAVVSLHTNLDQASGGVNDVLATALGLQQVRPLVLKPGFQGMGNGVGFGRIGHLADILDGSQFLRRLAEVLALPVLAVAGQLPATIRTVALCGGSGSDFAETAHAEGAQVYITGEVKHSTARWAEASGFCVVDAGHFATEYPVVPALEALLQQASKEKDWGVAVGAAENQKSPFAFHRLAD